MPTSSHRDEDYAVHTAVALTVNRYLIRHLVRMYRAFDGDLIECIVLGAVAHQNLAGLIGEAPTSVEFAERLVVHGRPRPDELLPTNAHSIALATGIPRETVRRKVAALVERGWLRQDERANLTCTSEPAAHFRAASEQSIRELLDAAKAISALRGRPGFPRSS
jgi:hypothetical protein